MVEPGIALAGDVDSVSIGAWQWSCAIDCAGTTCTLRPGTGEVVSGTLPDAIGRLSCRSKVTAMYGAARRSSAHAPHASSEPLPVR